MKGMKAIMDILKVRIKEAREKAGMSQNELGVAIGRSRSIVAQYEGGLVLPPVDMLVDIARATSHPVSWFFGEENIDDRLPSTKADIALVIEKLDAIQALLTRDKEKE